MSEERFGFSGSPRISDAVGSTPSGTQEAITFPTGTYDPGEYRFGMPASMGFGGGAIGSIMPPLPDGGAGTGFDMVPETITADIDFVASESEDVIIPLGSEVKFLLLGRLYIESDPGAAFNEWTSYTFYSKSTMKGADAYYRNVAKIAYTELEVATTGSDANITPDDHSVFAEQNIAKFLDDGEIVRIETIGDTMTAEDTVGAHIIDTGMSRMSEFSGVPLYNMEGENSAYLRVEFGSIQSVNLKLELVLVQ